MNTECRKRTWELNTKGSVSDWLLDWDFLFDRAQEGWVGRQNPNSLVTVIVSNLQIFIFHKSEKTLKMISYKFH